MIDLYPACQGMFHKSHSLVALDPNAEAGQWWLHLVTTVDLPVAEAPPSTRSCDLVALPPHTCMCSSFKANAEASLTRLEINGHAGPLELFTLRNKKEKHVKFHINN